MKHCLLVHLLAIFAFAGAFVGCSEQEDSSPTNVPTEVGPTADYSMAPSAGEAPLSVQFADDSAPGTSPITTWEWSFGDGGTSTQPNPVHVYSEPGDYTVSLKVSTAVGSDTAMQADAIRVTRDVMDVGPTADFLASPVSGNAPLTVDFSDQSIPGSAAIHSWNWDFGDGGTSIEQNPSHTYQDEGSYDVSLTVTTDAGSDTKTAVGEIQVQQDLATLKAEVLKRYAPRVVIAASGLQGGGRYLPSSVDWAMEYLNRTQINGKNWVVTKDVLSNATSILPWFRGGDPVQINTVPTYAFWIQDPNNAREWIDLVYWFYYPYNRGKDAFDSVWGNHVGDWEHITLRVDARSLEPYTVALSAHGDGEQIFWSNIEKTDGTHPVVYAAWGSHANYSTSGSHHYKTIDVPWYVPYPDIDLIDLCSPQGLGLNWDTWHSIQSFDFFGQQALGSVPWPWWMSDDFESPSSLAVYRWGNTERDCEILGFSPGVCLLENGPTGPISKTGVWDIDKFE